MESCLDSVTGYSKHLIRSSTQVGCIFVKYIAWQEKPFTCFVSDRASQVTPALVPRWHARLRRRSHLSPGPACTAARRCRTSSTEHKPRPAGAGSELRWDGPGPRLSPGSQGTFVKGLQPRQTESENTVYKKGHLIRPCNQIKLFQS